MAVKIRLSRIGKKNAPFFRIVAIDSRSARDGAPLEVLGTYNPVLHEVIQFHEERVNYWVSTGAQVSDTVKKIHKLYKSASAQRATA